ncbi:acyl-CoA synthetase [Rhizoclosmatium globosum]|uniref:Acyl-CoA synthetase n=1 Tax=Rhizoclosmatium globosum TaxID=329046 RepID=A0A1Y2BXQ0_9FUNG|nr:acyl-CoA synthetase [Rhizoclosmatium globosum]|eukprot:ORY39427.1 acyl-CoA synthetase [Rhizoclosmatium globosum]
MPQALSIALPGTATPTSTAIYRNASSANGLHERPAEGINTIQDMFNNGFRNMASKEVFGSRRLLNTIEEQKEVTKKLADGTEIKETKTWKFFELGPYEWKTWAEAEKITGAYASGYRALGLKKGDKLTIYADTSCDWMFTAMALVQQGIVITTAYATLGEDGLAHSLNECEVTTIFTSAELLPVVVKVASKCKDLKHIVYSGAADSTIPQQVPHLKVLSLSELESLGNQHPVAPVSVDKEDLALIMYTSGSTGPPKGVMITHANVVAACTGGIDFLRAHTDPTETYLGYLPLAHILEFAVEIAALYMGWPIGYGSVKTLTSLNVRNCKGDLQELRPTTFAGVPQVWEGIRKAVTAKISASSPIAQAVFRFAYNAKRWCMNNRVEFLAYPLDALIFSKIKAQVGGRLKFALSGGAALPKSTHEFLNVTAVKIANGYGMTECTAVIALQDLTRIHYLGETGTVVTSMEMKLVDCPELGYRASNVPRPQGEVWLRGPSVMKGYYKQPQLTSEAFSEDGWLKTGDIGEFNEDGALILIDRKKNLIKLSNGEYIALEKLEANYKSYAIALIQPVEKEIRALAGELANNPNLDVEHLDYDELCARKDIRNRVHGSLNEIAKSLKFKTAEIVGSVVLTPEEWTPQNGMLTPAMKLQRKFIVDRYRTAVAEAYTVA